MIFFQFIFVILTFFFENVILIDLLQLKNIRKMSKTILTENLNQSLHVSQTGPKPGSYLDYPGLDNEKIKKNEIIWDLYYKCLNEFNKYINIINNNIQAKVITTYRSSSINLECDLCISPKDLNYKNVWFYSWIGNPNNLSLIQENDYYHVSSLDLSLNIINIDEYKSGFYQCKLFNSEAGPYFIELKNDNDYVIDMNNTHPTHTTNNNLVLNNMNLIIWTRWTQWSQCSKCDTMGKKIKFGHCYVSIKNNTFDDVSIKDNSSIKIMPKNYNDEEIYYLKNLLNGFYIGLPCQSSLLNLSYYFDTNLKKKATKIMVKYCEVKCKNNNIFEIRDFQGIIKEKVNNSAGVYSPLQQIPELPPKVETSIIIVLINEQLNITCPGNLNSNAPYEWRLNNQTISTTNDHMGVDILNRLILKHITEEDEKIFTCWQVDELAGIVQIKIIKEFKITIQEDIYFCGVFFVLAVFIWVSIQIYFDRGTVYY